MAQPNWFRKVRRGFSRYAARFVGKPINYVEIGCWIGGSASWVAENVLTHPDSHGFGIDPYAPMGGKHTAEAMQAVQAEARAKLSPYESAGKWTWIVGRSQDVLRTWPHGRIDFLYIDGSHHGHDALSDFVLAWPYLRKGSLVIWDDYGIGVRKRLKTNMPEVPDAVNAILMTFGLFVKAVGKGQQFAMEVTSHVMPGAPVHATDICDALAEGRGIDGKQRPLVGSAAWKKAGRVARRRRLNPA